jgi:hypothetical protein
MRPKKKEPPQRKPRSKSCPQLLADIERIEVAVLNWFAYLFF